MILRLLAYIKFILFVVLAFAIVFSTSINRGVIISNGQQTSPKQENVFVMYAASLTKPFEDSLGPSFEKKTGYSYMGEGRGSVQIANMIIDGQRKPDVFVSAGTNPIIMLMMNNSGNIGGKQQQQQQQQQPITQWLVKFASTEMVIAYLPTSKFHLNLDKAKKGEIPWYQVLSQPGFKFGRTDPELDPKGYYMVMAAKLANIYYKDQNIKQRIIGQDRNPTQMFPEETLTTTLETGQLDAISAYKHEAIAKGLSYITLPPQINLGDPNYSDLYKKVSYTFSTGKVVYGEPIYFSVTIPEATVKNLDGAVSFVTFLLSTDAHHILESQGLNYIKAIAGGKVDKIPTAVRSMIL
ncbi:MAG TPA: extracellular solute-binding protein [Nitrososphaeraceae archaeon]|nr:extracellular solute-binding protein [Nitrososphaeraceae archaeon]